MAAISLHDIDATVKELRPSKELGFVGMALPAFGTTARTSRATTASGPRCRTWSCRQLTFAIASTLPSTGSPDADLRSRDGRADIFTGVRNLLRR